MNNITQELLNEFEHCQNRIHDISIALFDRAKDIFYWENKNIGKDHELIPSSHWELVRIILSNKDEVGFECHRIYDDSRDTWNFYIDKYKLFSDDWKVTALDAYNEEVKKEQHQKRLEEEALAKEAEIRERAEYERLKAKYEGGE